jgi:hypothetical protein
MANYLVARNHPVLNQPARNQDVAHIAGLILDSRLSGHKARLRSKLAHTRRILLHLHPRDTFEQERLEVLEGAVEYLDSPVKERAQAAIQMLEQLAAGDDAPINRLSRPA